MSGIFTQLEKYRHPPPPHPPPLLYVVHAGSVDRPFMASTYLGTSHPHHCSPANEHKDLSAESQESIQVGVFVLGSQCSSAPSRSCLPACLPRLMMRTCWRWMLMMVMRSVGRSVGRAVKRSNVLNVANVLVSCRGSGTIEIFPLSPL